MSGGLAGIFISGRDWLPASGAALAVALVLVGISYFRTRAPRWLRLSCAALKLVGLGALLACLLEPMWSEQRAKPGANLFAVVADNSRSLTVHDKDAADTRGQTLAKRLQGTANTWRQTLAENFEVKPYLADSRLLPTTDFRELAFDGDATLPGRTFSALAERHRGQPLAGALFLTDGIIPDLTDFTGLPPIYPVIFASDEPERDLAIGPTAVTQTAFEDTPVTVQAEISANGFPGEEIVARLYAIPAVPIGAPAELAPVAEQTLTVPRDSTKVSARLQFRPAQIGVLFYRLRIEPKNAKTPEAMTANNETVVVVDRGSGKQRVLYVSGRPNWEYKFLSRAIAEDDQTQLVGLLRIAKREPKFEFRSRAGESSNPLFRGFGNQSKEEIERYDQPVLVRLGTEDEMELRGGFPKSAEDLFRYRAVIIDDLEAEFFTPDQMTLLQRFVSERGGGLLVLGGAEALVEGKYARTAIGDMLPVYFQGAPAMAVNDGPWKLALTREGFLEPWTRLRNGEAEENARLEALPTFDVINQVGNPKPAASVVARVTNGARELPALVTQRFGRGRTAAFLIGDFFQSGLGDEARQKDLGRAWRQIIRWLIADVPEAIEARVEQVGEAVKIQVRARDAKFQPIDNARVTVSIASTDAAAAAVQLPTEPSASEAGLFEASYYPRTSGGYRVQASVEGETGTAAGAAQTGWTTDLFAAEFRNLRPNRAALEQLAKQTGGRVVDAADLEKFARDLPTERAPITEIHTEPLWHTPWMMLFALLCFIGEWTLRRRHGLA